MVPNVPDVVTFSSLDVKKAEEVFVTMRTDGVVPDVPDVVTYNNLICEACVMQDMSRKLTRSSIR